MSWMDAGEYLQNQVDDLVREPVPDPLRVLGVVGNGLDLAVGIPSSYREFRNYFQGVVAAAAARGDEEPQQVMTELGQVMYDDWRNFEEALGQIGLPEGLADMDYADEGDLRELDYLDGVGAEYGEMFRGTVSDAFANWVQHKVDPCAPTLTPRSVAELVKDCEGFVTFNYTSTLENSYGVAPERVLHVHGTPVEGNGPYFGCPPGRVQQVSGNNSASNTARQKALEDLVESLTKKPRVELLDRFLAHATQLTAVHSYGVSFGEADRDYFEAIVGRCSQETTWVHYCYTTNGWLPEETEDAERCTDMLGSLAFPGWTVFRAA